MPEIVTQAVAGVIQHRKTGVAVVIVCATMAAGLKLVWASPFEDGFKVFMALMGVTGTVVGFLYGRHSQKNGAGDVD